ncbi:hypothetical protein STHERM_c17790 [Spirochaeta thermophila DSM 6192]|uniref:Uncharacterized protein n=1 Tax=Winmispira thermophila (strain ATCC 49972 / DSM 6192 / RI 19.B1) TaxID=665571 RepID=E0RP52_WINT6|nr:hypothetical protein STHERM_c17790 [Spirochaeta thermophila DSM 6192]
MPGKGPYISEDAAHLGFGNLHEQIGEVLLSVIMPPDTCFHKRKRGFPR